MGGVNRNWSFGFMAAQGTHSSEGLVWSKSVR